MSKRVGILGGMGPEATQDLFLKIIKATPVKQEQDHLRIVIDCNPKIPDRTKAILHGGTSPVDAIIETGRNLVMAGAEVICIPCITSHAFIDQVIPNISVPIVNPIAELSKYIDKHYPKAERIGILATNGTVSTRLIEKYIAKNIIYPDNNIQEQVVMSAITAIKIGKEHSSAKNDLIYAGEHLIEKGAKLLVGGCTEISAVLSDSDFSIPLLDPMSILAEAIVLYCSN